MWLLAAAGGGAVSVPIVKAITKALLGKRNNLAQVKRLAIVQAWYRLASLGLYARAEGRFLKKHPNEADAAAKVKRKLHEQLGLSTGRSPAKTKLVADAALRAVDRPAS